MITVGVTNDTLRMCPLIHENGYDLGDYWDGYDIVRVCGCRVVNPLPNGRKWVEAPGFFNRLFHRGHWEDRYPDFILGKRGEPWKK